MASVLYILLLFPLTCPGAYVLDDSVGLGRRFDGIGGLSGGGATSRLLVSYPETQKSDILDMLFKPNFGASLQILKVEIGGDAQSTDGTESSHMHSAGDLNYNRGYEWWLMSAAKKINPNIKLYALPWAFPAWVGEGSGDPYMYPGLTAEYITKWILGAKQQYGLDIDYVGIWNERSYNITYIETLRMTLDKNGLSSVQIVASDSSFEPISSDILNSSSLSDAVSIIGAHYPGTFSDKNAVLTNKPLWASEDYSTYNDNVGAGCWARILNQNYVNGNMTATISWNLIASYYEGLPYYRDGLMTATEPWSGNYAVNGPIWITAHTTQFTEPGFHYLKHGYGAGHLDKNGSYVTLVDPNNRQDFTIVIETMTHDHSICIRPKLPAYTVEDQNTTFQLKGSFANTKELNVWMSSPSFSSKPDVYFQKTGTIQVKDGVFSIHLPPDSVVSLTTSNKGFKGKFDIPDSKPFPLPYMDNFDDYPLSSEASYFADQTGVYEIVVAKDTSHGKVMRQMVPTRPITWCDDPNQTITLMGQISWSAKSVSVDVLAEVDGGVFVAFQISQGGCAVGKATGVFFWLNIGSGIWRLTTDLAGTKVLEYGFTSDTKVNSWYTLQMVVSGLGNLELYIDKTTVAKTTVPSRGQTGFVGFGTSAFFAAQFDNFKVNNSSPFT